MTKATMIEAAEQFCSAELLELGDRRRLMAAFALEQVNLALEDAASGVMSLRARRYIRSLKISTERE